MRSLLLLVFVPFLGGCEMSEAFVGGASSPVDPDITAIGTGILGDVSSSNWIGAAYGVGALVAAVFAKQAGGHIVKRMKDSEPGKIV